MDYFLAKATSTASLYKPVLECLETLSENQRKFSLQDDVQLVNAILSPHHCTYAYECDLLVFFKRKSKEC
ncbi:hypothetical protein HRI_002242500 [Hibiscus trionum]|uniref:Uncharacterized protein n=1 Tax=Hibiscus trionum TaxID=183268 RepID=A0A9W7HYH1_HIBTR|nr:hypothetical protein HRI_002242500 [Hibiscus trionum]